MIAEKYLKCSGWLEERDNFMVDRLCGMMNTAFHLGYGETWEAKNRDCIMIKAEHIKMGTVNFCHSLSCGIKNMMASDFTGRGSESSI